MKKAINFMEFNLGQKKKDIDFKNLEDLMGVNYKISNIVQRAMTKFYYFSPLKFEEILEDNEIKRFNEFGIKNSFDFRNNVFKHINKGFGFVKTKEKEKFFEELQKIYGVEKDKIQQLLWSDIDPNQVLRRLRINRETVIDDLLDYYNYLSLIDVLKGSSMMLIEFGSGIKPDFIKDVYWLCKKTSMLCDFTQKACTIFPPKEMISRNYGYILSYILRRITKYNPDEVIVRVKRKRVELKGDILQKCLKITPEEENLSFDSTIEELFYKTFGDERNHWKLVREPEPIIEDDFIFIPDFCIERGKRKFYVEVIGFWTDDYRARKREKLKKIRDLPIIILVNKKYKNEFYDLGFPMFTYDKDFPIASLIDFLSIYEIEEVEEKRHRVLKNKDKIIESLGQKEFVNIKELSEILNCYEENVSEIMEDIKDDLKGNVFFESVGLLSKKLYDSLIEKDFSGDFKKVKGKLGNIPITFLEKIGYRIEWHSLNDAVVKKYEK